MKTTFAVATLYSLGSLVSAQSCSMSLSRDPCFVPLVSIQTRTQQYCSQCSNVGSRAQALVVMCGNQPIPQLNYVTIQQWSLQVQQACGSTGLGGVGGATVGTGFGATSSIACSQYIQKTLILTKCPIPSTVGAQSNPITGSTSINGFSTFTCQQDKSCKDILTGFATNAMIPCGADRPLSELGMSCFIFS